MCAIKQNIHGKLRGDIVFFVGYGFWQNFAIWPNILYQSRVMWLWYGNYSWPRVMV